VPDPLALVPLAAAAGGGTIDGLPATQLVAAGFTLLQRSAPLVRALQGKRAAILIPTSPQFFTGLAACDGRGAVLINPLAAPGEIAYQIDDAGVGAVFTVAALAPRLPHGCTHVLLDGAPRSARVVAGGAAVDIDLGSHVGLQLEGERGVQGVEEECAVVYTSAMAGQALGAILTHRNLIANARQAVEAGEFASTDRYLAALPFAHLFGLTVTGTAALMAGGRVTTMPRFNPIAALDVIVADAVTVVVGVPAIFAGLLAVIERRGRRLDRHALRLCLCGGAPLDAALQERWFEATGTELRQGYGLTEASPVCLFNRPSLPNRRGTLGVAFPGCEVTVRDPVSHAELPTGMQGEICIRGETVFAGYLNRGALGLQVREGWLGSGDRGVRNADGTITFVGLIKDMFTRSGFNVYPAEVARVVGAMPGVRSARVFAIPEASKENDVCVEITGSVSEAGVKQWCETRLSAYKQPTVIRIASE
jgi:long-chain acyl-CoA synthetase